MKTNGRKEKEQLQTFQTRTESMVRHAKSQDSLPQENDT